MTAPAPKLEIRIRELNNRITDAYETERRGQAGETGCSCTSSPSVPCCCSQPAMLNLRQMLEDLASAVMQSSDPPAAYLQD